MSACCYGSGSIYAVTYLLGRDEFASPAVPMLSRWSVSFVPLCQLFLLALILRGVLVI